jgi:hypothetical protein
MGYPGGKSGAGVYQRLINEIPPHDVYVAGFAGHDAIAQFKRPAARNVLIDLDPEPLSWWARALKASPLLSTTAAADESGGEISRWELHKCSAVDWLRITFGLTELLATPDTQSCDRTARYQNWFVYLDPPYLMSTRSSGPMYRHEMTDAQHAELLDVARQLPCKVMLCGYWSDLYAEALSDWRVVKYTATARSGERRTEYAWCNFEHPTTLHDSRYVGSDKREREKVRRRIKRLSRNLARLPDHERQAVLDAVASTSPPVSAPTAVDAGSGVGRSSDATAQEIVN